MDEDARQANLSKYTKAKSAAKRRIIEENRVRYNEIYVEEAREAGISPRLTDDERAELDERAGRRNFTEPVLVWKEPPPVQGSGPGGRTSPWDPIVAELRRHPDEWALIAEDTTSRINGKYPAFRPIEEFEVVVRSTGRGRGRHDIYARYVGHGPGGE